ncbi:MAG: tetratricopeptide repeat protein [bacterium]
MKLRILLTSICALSLIGSPGRAQQSNEAAKGEETSTPTVRAAAPAKPTTEKSEKQKEPTGFKALTWRSREADTGTTTSAARATQEVEYEDEVSSPSGAAVTDAINEGRRLIREEKYEEAHSLLSEALKRHPNASYVRVHLARALLGLGRVDEGLAEAQEAARQLPDSSIAFNTAGRALRLKGKSMEALQAFRKAVENDPHNPWPCNNAGLIQFERGELAKAEELFSMAVQSDGENPIFWFNLGRAHFEKKDYARASAAFERTLQLDPDYSEAKRYLNQIPTEREDSATTPTRK